MPQEKYEIGKHLIDELRQRFLGEYSLNHDLYDEQDINDVRNKEYTVRKFIQRNRGNVEEAFKMMVNTMKWRKTMGINKITEIDIPREYFQIGGLFTYGKDLNGAQMIIFRVKQNKRINEWTDALKKYILYLIEKEDLRFATNENNGVCLVFDCSGAGITNLDIDLLSFIVATMRDYYPTLLKSVLVNELPWVLQYVFKLVQSWLPKEHQKLLHLISNKELTEYVSTEELPDFLGGSNQQIYKTDPKNSPTASELAPRIGLKQKDVDKLLKHLEPYLNGV